MEIKFDVVDRPTPEKAFYDALAKTADSGEALRVPKSFTQWVMARAYLYMGQRKLQAHTHRNGDYIYVWASRPERRKR